MHFLNLEGFLLTVILSLVSEHNNFCLQCSILSTLLTLSYNTSFNESINNTDVKVWSADLPDLPLPAHTGPRRFRLPNAWAPTLVGTKLLCPSPPDRLRKSAKRWVTQVAVLHARFCAVALLERMEEKITLILILSSIINKKLRTILIQGKYSNNCVSIIDSHAYPFLLSFFVFFNY